VSRGALLLCLVILILFSEQSRALCVNCEPGPLTRNLEQICQVGRSEPGFLEACESVPEYLRLTCFGGSVNLFDRLGLRGAASGIAKGVFDFGADMARLTTAIGVGGASLVWTHYLSGVSDTAREMKILRRLYNGEKVPAEEIEALNARNTVASQRPGMNIDITPALRLLGELSVDELARVKSYLNEIIVDRAMAFACMRKEAQQEVIFRLLANILFPPAVFIKFISVARHAKSLVNFYELMGDSLSPLMRAVEKVPVTGRTLRAGNAAPNLAKLADLIPRQKRSTMMVIEFTDNGHVAARYFDGKGVPRAMHGNVMGPVRINPEWVVNKGQHFAVEMTPDAFQNFTKFASNREGKFSWACTREANEALKASGINLNLPQVPTSGRTYEALLEASRNPQNTGALSISTTGSELTQAELRDAAARIDRKAMRLYRWIAIPTAYDGIKFVLGVDEINN
jgi:hypothetical protein